MGNKLNKKAKFSKEKVREPIEFLTAAQEHYGSALNEVITEEMEEVGDGTFVIAHGAAGTGKTWLAAMLGSDLYLQGEYSQMVITRPTVGCGEDMGALPGELDEKYDPWVDVVVKPIQSRIGVNQYETDVKNGNIIVKPLQFMRGETFDYSFVIIDESQNLTVDQVKMLMTRAGQFTKMVFCGDEDQNDHKMIYRTGQKEQSGLDYLLDLLKTKQPAGIEVIKFTAKDNVRSGASRKALALFS